MTLSPGSLPLVSTSHIIDGLGNGRGDGRTAGGAGDAAGDHINEDATGGAGDAAGDNINGGTTGGKGDAAGDHITEGLGKTCGVARTASGPSFSGESEKLQPVSALFNTELLSLSVSKPIPAPARSDGITLCSSPSGVLPNQVFPEACGNFIKPSPAGLLSSDRAGLLSSLGGVLNQVFPDWCSNSAPFAPPGLFSPDDTSL